MKIRQIPRSKLLVIDVRHTDLGRACAEAASHAETKIGGLRGEWALNIDAEQLLIYAEDREAWLRALAMVRVYILDIGRADDGVYGTVDLTESFRGEDNVYWIERVSPPTDDLVVEKVAGRRPTVWEVSHINPVGEREQERVSGANALDAVESYARRVFELYGTAHHVHGNGYLSVRCVDPNGDVRVFDVARDSTIMEASVG